MHQVDALGEPDELAQRIIPSRASSRELDARARIIVADSKQLMAAISQNGLQRPLSLGPPDLSTTSGLDSGRRR